MNRLNVKLPQLDAAQLKRVKQLEKELATWVVALPAPVRIADLSEEQLAKLQAAEKELGLVLLAYQTS